MFFRSFIKITTLALMFALLVEIPALAVEKKINSKFGLRFGYYGGGDMEVEDFNFETESGFIGGVYFDYPLKGSFMPGFSIDINEIVIPHGGGNETSKTSLQLALTLKRPFPVNKGKMYLRPGIGFGLGFVPEIYFVDNSLHYTFRTTNDFVFPLNPKAAFVAELGFLWDLHGSDGDYDMSGGPFLFMRGGFEF